MVIFACSMVIGMVIFAGSMVIRVTHGYVIWLLTLSVIVFYTLCPMFCKN